MAGSSKTGGIVIIVILLIVLIGFGIWIYVSSKNKTGFFAPYDPAPNSTTGLIQSVPSSRFEPLTAEEKAKKDAMIAIALQIAANKPH